MGEAFITRRGSQSNVEIFSNKIEESSYYEGYIDELDFNKNDYICVLVSKMNNYIYSDTYYIKNGVVAEEYHTYGNGAVIIMQTEGNERINFTTKYGNASFSRSDSVIIAV